MKSRSNRSNCSGRTSRSNRTNLTSRSNRTNITSRTSRTSRSSRTGKTNNIDNIKQFGGEDIRTGGGKIITLKTAVQLLRKYYQNKYDGK